MCGLAGLARIDGRHLDEGSDVVLKGMMHAVSHRGPDAEEMLREGPVGLAFTRLSLVGPDNGSQPLHSEDGSVVLIANGEVYNHRELAASLPAGTRMRTKSDCEVLVHLYQIHGLDFLDNVRGMFGLILWDRKRNKLILGRDHFGVKPLYYTRNRERIALASEIKALFVDPATPRQLAWDDALAAHAFNSSPILDSSNPLTWFEGVSLVPAGTILEIDLSDGRTNEHKYWQLPSFVGDSDASDRELITSFREILASAVDECATADAGVGLFLSGGIDSAAIAALAAQSADLETFTVLSGSTLVSQDAEYAHRISKLLGVPNHQVLFKHTSIPSVDEWKNLLWLTEMPTCNAEQYFKRELHRHVRAEFPHIKGMLIGSGADEFCGGYSVQTSGGGGWDAFTGVLQQMSRGRRSNADPDCQHGGKVPKQACSRRVLFCRGVTTLTLTPTQLLSGLKCAM